MELLVIIALGLVIACGYRTLNDILGDLRREEVLPVATPCSSLADRVESAVRLAARSRQPYPRIIFLDAPPFFQPRRTAIPVTVRYQDAESRFYRAHHA